MVEKVSTDPELVGRVVSRSDDDSTEEDEPPNSKDRRQLTKDLLLHPIWALATLVKTPAMAPRRRSPRLFGRLLRLRMLPLRCLRHVLRPCHQIGGHFVRRRCLRKAREREVDDGKERLPCAEAFSQVHNVNKSQRRGNKLKAYICAYSSIVRG
jgi:hypothetical protein